MIKPRANAHGLRVSWQSADGIPSNVSGDEIRVQQVLLNLLTNALKFTPFGSICVRLSLVGREGNYVRLRWEVRDTGIGIPDDQQSVIFDRFTQVSGAGVPAGGAGLGLAICKRLIELMRGEIGVESKLGLGSTFRFELPLGHSPNEAHSDREQGQQILVARRRRVLLVDDDPINQSLLLQLIESLGHHVFAAASGNEAISKFRDASFDLAILDWQMPDMNGGQLAAALRALERELKRPPMTLIALSAAMDREPKRIGDGSYFGRWLTKPVSQAELAIVLGATQVKCDESEHCATRWSQPLARLGGRSELLTQLAESYSAGLPEILNRLRTAAKESRAEDVARIAHLISGQASVFDADELASIAKTVEESAHGERLDSRMLTVLETRCRELVVELECWSVAETAQVR
jgi:CheY-like chemotaxis protein